ncbi:MAG: XdhC family protein [Burkholderiaceae bacterium]|nr:XdhC family protein [Burkholderiaceae bacterium]
MKREIFERLLSMREAATPCALLTRLADGTQALFDGTLLEGELDPGAHACAAIAEMLVFDRSAPLAADPGLFVRVYAPKPRMLIVGAVHVAQALAPMAAIAGFAVTVIDPRGAFAQPERFPGVELLVEWPDEALARVVPDSRTAFVTLSHDPKIDDPALATALVSPAFYVGALGSRKTHAARVDRLGALGLGERVNRIHAPIGIDLGGRAPAEIAVAILAQVIQVRYHGAGQ